MSATITEHVKIAARELGFDLVGIAAAESPPGFPSLKDWLAAGYAGEMGYLARRIEAYEDPSRVLPGVRSLVMVGLNYKTSAERPQAATDAAPARIAAYAISGHDYHDHLKQRLRQLAEVLHQSAPGCKTRCVVDTAPLLERDFARLAGLGWFGKNTMLIHKRAGSLLLLGAVLTDVELIPDAPHATSHCGTCTRCLDACPTAAFPEPGVLDARRCISYLTIELKGAIPSELRPGIGDWLFGCDICQDVCPWNRKSPVSYQPIVQPRSDLQAADAVEILSLSDEELTAWMAGSPLERPGLAGVRRNAAIVAGNSGQRAAVTPLISRLDDAAPIVRGAAAWALGRFEGPEVLAALRQRRVVEDNPEVTAELDDAITAIEARIV